MIKCPQVNGNGTRFNYLLKVVGKYSQKLGLKEGHLYDVKKAY